jgi:hypothetical protein
MNHWQNEFMAEYHRQELLAEAEQIRLEKLALESRKSCPTLFERTIFAFANWMISTGKCANDLKFLQNIAAMHPRVTSQTKG